MKPVLVFWFCAFSPFFSWSQTPTSQIFAEDQVNFSSPWGVSYFNFASSSVGLMDEGAASWNIYHHVAFNRRWDWSRRLSLRIPFFTQTPGVHDRRENVRNFSTQLGDLHAVWNHFQFLELPHEWDVNASYYLYLPTSENSQRRRWITRLRAWWTLEHRPNRRSLMAFWIQPQYFFNTQKAYRDDQPRISADGRTFQRVFARNNLQRELKLSWVFNYALNTTFTPQLLMGYNQSWFENSQFVDRGDLYRSSWELQVGTWLKVSRTLKFLAGYIHEYPVTGRFAENAQWFDPQNSTYFVMTFWNFF